MKTKLRIHKLSTSEKEKIYREHWKLVISIAKKYVGKSSNLTLEDLIQEGILGLFKAAERFDPEKGFRFSTYAYQWIRAFIKRALENQEKTIRIPVNLIESLTKYWRVRKELLEKRGHEPSKKEIAKLMKTTVTKVERIENFLQNPPTTISFDLSEEDSQDGRLIFLKDEKTESPPEAADRHILTEEFERSLSPREELIIKLKFGLNGEKEHTLREIHKKIGLSHSRIQQIIKNTLKRFKKPC